jgi:hypothetical protein
MIDKQRFKSNYPVKPIQEILRKPKSKHPEKPKLTNQDYQLKLTTVKIQNPVIQDPKKQI